ncbi:MAG: hypothetical protein K2X73_13385 [Sphingomonas sp.]|uniref:SAM-dependent methyltransferase n=1 Tax=Sphingomonas sp. TaxID=28214 RepID=UPI0025FEB5EF|nr:SAM-dependent methyltransferase [Sphingomonas sp.]MBX9882953.1 hypothetical protein [Sphingomonas sp.]
MRAETVAQDETARMVARWRELAAAIAARTGEDAPIIPGELSVLGSGIAHNDIMVSDETALLHADVVFHCLYDRVTESWINQLRPDAYDLRILYNPSVARHLSYVCMAEALLHFVRQGKKVVAMFYGHPGFFATPTHRAIKVARAEGHRTTMRPGISALDHLVADLGFDPMIPGLISFEASELVYGGRVLDPSLHTILWQIGAVGDYGFAPGGFENKGFERLLDRLIAAFGEDWTAVHYIAPHYVGLDPVIEAMTLAALRDPAAKQSISAISTLYLAPMVGARDGAIRQRTQQYALPEWAAPITERSAPPRHAAAFYGQVEQAALALFQAFVPPDHYRATPPTAANQFLQALSRDVALLERFSAAPGKVLADPRFAALSPRARRLLQVPHPRAINAALNDETAMVDGPDLEATAPIVAD